MKRCRRLMSYLGGSSCGAVMVVVDHDDDDVVVVDVVVGFVVDDGDGGDDDDDIASVCQGHICSDNCTCFHSEIKVADQTFYLTHQKLRNAHFLQSP